MLNLQTTSSQTSHCSYAKQSCPYPEKLNINHIRTSCKGFKLMECIRVSPDINPLDNNRAIDFHIIMKNFKLEELLEPIWNAKCNLIFETVEKQNKMSENLTMNIKSQWARVILFKVKMIILSNLYVLTKKFFSWAIHHLRGTVIA